MAINQSIKIIKLIVRNFRGIGPNGLEIDIDDIVVLVGPNNSGKSTILRAFKLVTGSDTKIKIDDFHKKDTQNKPEIEVWSKVLDYDNVNIDKDKWIDKEGIVKEKWLWTTIDNPSKRIGFRIDLQKWTDDGDTPKAPFSNDSAASAYRPSPTHISPFDQPEKQVDEIKKIISTEIYEDIKAKKKKDCKYTELQGKIEDLQKEIRTEAETEERQFEEDLGKILDELFTGTKVTLDVPQNNPDILSSYATFKEIDLKIDNLSLDNQGSGMQRALLWSVLKNLACREKNNVKKSRKKTDAIEESNNSDRTKILLMDEPEICLHPESIRQAKEILYSLALSGEWQIMITTHSPIFIDLSKNNTNIIRVQKEEEKVSLFRTNEAGLSDDEKEQLKMLNISDPYFAEFFFSKNVIVVEGDTEYTAFRKIIVSDTQKYKDIHIIRARGKYTILPIVKILMKWGKDFSVLHDSDDVANKQSWPANEQILRLVTSNEEANIKLLASKKNFEASFFGDEVAKDKPFNAYEKMNDVNLFNKVASVFDYMCGLKAALSDNDKLCVCEYKTIDELKNFVQ